MNRTILISTLLFALLLDSSWAKPFDTADEARTTIDMIYSGLSSDARNLEYAKCQRKAGEHIRAEENDQALKQLLENQQRVEEHIEACDSSVDSLDLTNLKLIRTANLIAVGGVYSRLGETALAREYFEKALAVADRANPENASLREQLLILARSGLGADK